MDLRKAINRYSAIYCSELLPKWFPAIFSPLLLKGLFLSTPLQSTDLCNVAGMKSAAQGVEIWLTESQTDEEACFNH